MQDQPEVKNVGQIAVMKLPQGFVFGKRSDPQTSSSFFEEHHLEADPEVKVYFEYRGRRMSEKSSLSFSAVLGTPPHNLTQMEVDSLKELLTRRNDPDTFRMFVAKTQDIKGKRVLVIEGVFLEFNLQVRTLYVDSDGTGSAVQEISFQTPKDRFVKYLLPGTRSLETITWK